MQGLKSTALPEIEYIDRLEAIEDEYADRFGVRPFNLSHWDSTPEFETPLLSCLHLPAYSTFTSYRFSYQLTETAEVIEKLGGNPNLHSGLITPSSTTAIVCLLNWLKNRGASELLVLCPAYFSIFHVARHFGLATRKAYMRRIDSQFRLPPRTSPIWKSPSVLWLTSPVYGAGVYLVREDVAFLNSLLNSGWTIVADECLAYPDHELIRKLGNHANFISVYSPHKCVCINGVKFAVTVFHNAHLPLMEKWSDIWYGGVSLSSSVAIRHFLSPNYQTYCEAFRAALVPAKDVLRTTSLSHGAQTDDAIEGHFASCYFPHASAGMGNSLTFLREIVFETGCSLITGNRSRFNPQFGFCFRINLARTGTQFEAGLTRLVRYLESRFA